VSQANSVVDVLRTVRGAEDPVLAKLKAESLEARRDRIAAAVASTEWAAGPAELIATYPHHALVSKDGAQLRVRVTESEGGQIVLDKVEVFSLAQPTPDVVDEVFATAEAAVDHILREDFEAATPMVAAVANAIYTSGDLHRRIATKVAERSIARSAWWHQVVREHMEKIGAVESIVVGHVNNPDSLLAAISDLKTTLIAEAKIAADAVNELAGSKSVSGSIQETARDVVADLKYAIQALAGTSSDNIEEATGVYEGVAAVANQLRLGARFLASLSKPQADSRA